MWGGSEGGHSFFAGRLAIHRTGRTGRSEPCGAHRPYTSPRWPAPPFVCRVEQRVCSTTGGSTCLHALIGLQEGGHALCSFCALGGHVLLIIMVRACGFYWHCLTPRNAPSTGATSQPDPLRPLTWAGQVPLGRGKETRKAIGTVYGTSTWSSLACCLSVSDGRGAPFIHGRSFRRISRWMHPLGQLSTSHALRADIIPKVLLGCRLGSPFFPRPPTPLCPWHGPWLFMGTSREGGLYR